MIVQEHGAWSLKHPFFSERDEVRRAWYDRNRERSHAVIFKARQRIKKAAEAQRQPPPPTPVLQPSTPKKPKRFIAGRLSGKDVLIAVSQVSGHSIAALKSPRRQGNLVHWRHIAMWIMQNRCFHMSLPSIGMFLGQRHHTTILHGARKVSTYLSKYEIDIKRVMGVLEGDE